MNTATTYRFSTRSAAACFAEMCDGELVTVKAANRRFYTVSVVATAQTKAAWFAIEGGL